MNIQKLGTFFQKNTNLKKIRRRFHAIGKCTNGDKCKFSHEIEKKTKGGSRSKEKNTFFQWKWSTGRNKTSEFCRTYKSFNNQDDNKVAILYSGCSTTVSGKVWIQEFINKYGKDVVKKREQDEELFMFGSSKVYKSEEKIALKIIISSLVCTIRVSVIDASIPLLIVNDVMVGLGISLINDVHKQESYIQIGIINKHLRKKGNWHWRINIEGVKEKDKNDVFVHHFSRLQKDILKSI